MLCHENEVDDTDISWPFPFYLVKPLHGHETMGPCLVKIHGFGPFWIHKDNENRYYYLFSLNFFYGLKLGIYKSHICVVMA